MDEKKIRVTMHEVHIKAIGERNYPKSD